MRNILFFLFFLLLSCVYIYPVHAVVWHCNSAAAIAYFEEQLPDKEYTISTYPAHNGCWSSVAYLPWNIHYPFPCCSNTSSSCPSSWADLGCGEPCGSPCPDFDEDGICDDVDNCIDVANSDQSDVDEDGVGDVCDNCIDVYNPAQYDFNEDGIGVACDGNENFQWRLQQYQKNDDGDYTWVRLEFDNGDLWDFGERDPEELDFVVISPAWHDKDTLSDWLDDHMGDDTDSGDGEPWSDDDGNEPSDGDSEDVGDGSTGGGSDTEILQNIESNTATTADNFQFLEDTLSALDIDIMRVGENVDNVVDGVRDVRTGLLNVESAVDGVSSDIQGLPGDIVAAQEESAQGEIATQNAYLDGVGSGTYDGYIDTDIPDTAESQTSYESAVSDIRDNSDLATVKTQVGVELSGSVSSVSCQAFGSQITFDFGKYNSIYSVMGVAWLSLCYLFGFFLIIRG